MLMALITYLLTNNITGKVSSVEFVKMKVSKCIFLNVSWIRYRNYVWLYLFFGNIPLIRLSTCASWWQTVKRMLTYSYLIEQKNCSETPGICHENASCLPSDVCASERPFSYRCVCNPGYSGDGTDCQGEITAEVMLSKDISPCQTLSFNYWSYFYCIPCLWYGGIKQCLSVCLSVPMFLLNSGLVYV